MGPSANALCFDALGAARTRAYSAITKVTDGVAAPVYGGDHGRWRSGARAKIC